VTQDLAGAVAPIQPTRALQAQHSGLDEPALARIQERVAAMHQGAKGSVMLSVSIAQTGAVVQAKVVGGTAPAILKNAMTRALANARLFRRNRV
jgi:outer membrane biosynthesis protein TonB